MDKIILVSALQNDNKFFQQIVINKGIKNAKDESLQGFVIHTTEF